MRKCVSMNASLFSQTRKPLVEKKRRARINESLQELRTLLAENDVSLSTTLSNCVHNRCSQLYAQVCLHLTFFYSAADENGERRGA